MKVSVRAEVGREYARFVRTMLKRVATRLISHAGVERSATADRRVRKTRGGASLYPGVDATAYIILIGDKRMRELHRRFMKVDSPTDVLTFPIDQREGEVYVNVAEARRQARLRGIDAKREVLLYAIHGMLHLLGYDDRTRRDFLMMHRMEDDILTLLGVGTVFGAREKGAR